MRAAIDSPSLAEAGVSTDQSGTMIGHYKLLQEIGEGGFGIVFMAEQQEPVQRKVAVKIIKAGMDTREVIARFEAERQALALMDHPNIAQVLDGGTTENGRPYFVMELVRGIPITQYCDQAELSTRERLELFIKVCRAIQHAHQKGVIHRDLKPGNILVTLHDGEPVPKVIDFGVAKALGQKLTEKTLFTRFEQMLGTPAYMSPEQAALGGLDIDTRSDVYSLGVLLYELLTGVTPLDAETLRQVGLDKVRQIIQETDPPSPSTRVLTLGKRLLDVARQRRAEPAALNRSLRGDLDWITMKALEKDRRRRYETVNGLAADVERYLRDEPVTARPPSTLYRLQKVARRHRIAFAAGVAVGVALLLGMVVSTWQAVRATRAEREQRHERLRADDEAARAKRLEAETREQLRRSYLDQARANRWSGRAGRRFESLDVLKKAADIRPSLELRNEAIACMALSDIRLAWQWELSPPEKVFMFFDSSFERYAKLDASQDLITIHRTRDDGELMRLPGFTLALSVEPRFSPNGQYLAVNSGPGEANIRVWDLNRKEIIFRGADSSWCRTMAFSPDSRSIAVAYHPNGLIVIYDLASAKTLKTFPQGPLPWSIAFDASGHKLAISSDEDHTVIIRDLETGEAAQSLPHPHAVKGVSWHPRSNFLATACMDRNLYIWDTSTGKLRTTLTGSENVCVSVHFDHSGDFLISDGWDSMLRLWDFWSGHQLVNTPIYDGGSFSSDDRWFTANLDRSKPAIWELTKAREYRLLHIPKESPKRPSSIDFSSDRGLFLSGHGDGVRLWDLVDFRERAFFGNQGCAEVAFHPNGKSFFTAGHSGVEQWPIEVRENDQSQTVNVGPPLPFGERLKTESLAISLDGRTLATVGDRFVHVFDIATRQKRHRFGAQPRAWCVSLSPDGKFVAATSFAHTNVWIWNLESGVLEQKLPFGATAQVAFSPDGKWLVAGDHAEYRFWRVGSWSPGHSISRRDAGNWSGIIAFSADAKMLAIADRANRVRLVDPQTGHEWATLEAPDTSSIGRLRFNSDGSQLAVQSSANYVIQFWDMRSIRRQLAPMKLDWDAPPLPAPVTNQSAGKIIATMLGTTNQNNVSEPRSP